MRNDYSMLLLLISLICCNILNSLRSRIENIEGVLIYLVKLKCFEKYTLFEKNIPNEMLIFSKTSFAYDKIITPQLSFPGEPGVYFES